MERIRKNIFIEAPPAKVFGYVADPLHLPEIWPSMVEISNVQTNADGMARSFDWIYKMAGMKFHGRSETLEMKRDRLIVRRSESGIPSTFRWSFEPRNSGTEFSAEIEYDIPGKLLSALAAPFLRRLNEREADVFNHNLKERMEAGEPAR